MRNHNLRKKFRTSGEVSDVDEEIKNEDKG